MSTKQVSFIFHFYQPSIQTKAVFKQVFDTCYNPLIKLIKLKKDMSFTFNMPLSFLELVDKYGYTDWLADVRKLHDVGIIEFVGSAAYHCLLTTVPERLAIEEIILNEYGLGYYLGKTTGFEGEKAVVLKNLNGFFAPELASNNELCYMLESLGYKWLLIDSCATPSVVKDKDAYLHTSGIKILVRDTEISNKIAFYRGYKVDEVFNLFTHSTRKEITLAFDAETFGHHNKDGILFLDSLLDKLEGSEEFKVAKATDAVLYLGSKIDRDVTAKSYDIVSASWGASKTDVQGGNFLPFWKNDSNELQSHINKLLQYLHSLYVGLPSLTYENNEFANMPFWKEELRAKIKDDELRQFLFKQLSLMKLIASDFLWWASGKKLYSGAIVYDAPVLHKFIALALAYGEYTKDNSIKELCEKISANL